MATQMLRGTPIQYEPKRVNRFVLEFPTELNIESYQVQKTTRPKVKINPVKIEYLNTASYVAGKYEWEPMTISFIDSIGPSTSGKLMQYARLMFESYTGRMGYAAGYMKDLVLKALDPQGVEVEKWILYEVLVVNLEFGENDHANDELQTITMTIQPRYCELAY